MKYTEEIDRNVETSLSILFSRFHIYRYTYGSKLNRLLCPRENLIVLFYFD